MTEYEVRGPFKVPIEKRPAGRKIGDPEEFWEKNEHLKEKKGIYVFGMRAGKGIVPYYVGKTATGFQHEAFHFHKLDKYNDALLEYKRGKPVMFFIVRPVKRGTVKKKEISKIEDFLIQVGIAKNSGLLNVRGTKQPKWTIAGVIRSNRGQSTKAARQFKAMMNL